MTKNSARKRAARAHQDDHPGTTFPDALRAVTLSAIATASSDAERVIVLTGMPRRWAPAVGRIVDDSTADLAALEAELFGPGQPPTAIFLDFTSGSRYSDVPIPAPEKSMALFYRALLEGRQWNIRGETKKLQSAVSLLEVNDWVEVLEAMSARGELANTWIRIWEAMGQDRPATALSEWLSSIGLTKLAASVVAGGSDQPLDFQDEIHARNTAQSRSIEAHSRAKYSKVSPDDDARPNGSAGTVGARKARTEDEG